MARAKAVSHVVFSRCNVSRLSPFICPTCPTDVNGSSLVGTGLAIRSMALSDYCHGYAVRFHAVVLGLPTRPTAPEETAIIRFAPSMQKGEVLNAHV